MEQTGRKVLYEGGMGEIVEKKSRFIVTVRKIEMKKKLWPLSLR